MQAKNHLSQKQRERLLKTLKEHENSYVREKVFILLLINDGKNYQEVSRFLDIAYPTVAYWGKGSEAATKCHATAINLSQQRFQKKLATQSIQKFLNRPGANSV